jgi:dienelactone hydrolase
VRDYIKFNDCDSKEEEMVEHESLSLDMGGQKYLIDRYSVKNGSAKRPIVVTLHGVDGMGGESGTEIRKLAEQFADAGFLVFVPHYFDSADGADSLPLEELLLRRVPRVGNYPPRIAAAIDHVLKQSGGDGHLGLVGLSLGGGLAIDYAQSMPATLGTFQIRRFMPTLVDFRRP